MGQITWKNVAAPRIGGAVIARNAASNNINNATQTIDNLLKAGRDSNIHKQDQEATLRSAVLSNGFADTTSIDELNALPSTQTLMKQFGPSNIDTKTIDTARSKQLSKLQNQVRDSSMATALDTYKSSGSEAEAMKTYLGSLREGGIRDAGVLDKATTSFNATAGSFMNLAEAEKTDAATRSALDGFADKDLTNLTDLQLLSGIPEDADRDKVLGNLQKVRGQQTAIKDRSYTQQANSVFMRTGDPSQALASLNGASPDVQNQFMSMMSNKITAIQNSPQGQAALGEIQYSVNKQFYGAESALLTREANIKEQEDTMFYKPQMIQGAEQYSTGDSTDGLMSELLKTGDDKSWSNLVSRIFATDNGKADLNRGLSQLRTQMKKDHRDWSWAEVDTLLTTSFNEKKGEWSDDPDMNSMKTVQDIKHQVSINTDAFIQDKESRDTNAKERIDMQVWATKIKDAKASISSKYQTEVIKGGLRGQVPTKFNVYPEKTQMNQTVQDRYENTTRFEQAPAKAVDTNKAAVKSLQQLIKATKLSHTKPALPSATQPGRVK